MAAGMVACARRVAPIVIARLKRYLQRFELYLFLREAWTSLVYTKKQFYGGVVSLKVNGGARGNVLVSYANQGLIMMRRGLPVPTSHEQYWKTIAMAQTFLDLGFNVDVIHTQNQRFIPWKRYDVIVDTRFNLQRLNPYLDRDCIKILHCDTAHIVFHNAAEMNRTLNLQERKGVTIPPNRFERPNLGPEFADYITTCGNEFTMRTYRYAKKPVYGLPITVEARWPSPKEKEFDECRKQFLWFASRGMVHKGLDLVLDAFVGLPEYRLTIVGPVEEEPEFVRLYRNELYHLPNIKLQGWMHKESADFKKLLDSSIAHVFTSCSESGAACVLETMGAGLIPIVNYESSVDVEDFGVLLKSASIDDIRDGVRTIANMPAVELQRRSMRAWEKVRTTYTREKFADSYMALMKRILTKHGKLPESS
jgi:glycosyltransferase involved in cell wall biosynthesis